MGLLRHQQDNSTCISQTWQICLQYLVLDPSRFFTVNLHLASHILRSTVLRSAKINIILHCECILSAVQLSLLCREHNVISQTDVLNLGCSVNIGWWVGKILGFDSEFVLYLVSKNTHLTQSTPFWAAVFHCAAFLLFWGLQYSIGWLRGAKRKIRNRNNTE